MRGSRCGWVLLFTLFLSIHLLGPVEPKPAGRHYQVTALGAFGGDVSVATGINDRGQVVGFAATPSGEPHAFLWENGTLRDLGTLGGRYSGASAINRRGQIVGVSETDTGSYHAFLWENGTFRDLTPLDTSFANATAINRRGEIVGFATRVVARQPDAIERDRGFLWRGGRLRFLSDLDPRSGTEEGHSYAYAINDRSQIVGSASSITGGPQQPVLWRAGRYRVTHLAQNGGVASAINNQGLVAGSFPYPNYEQAFVWRKGRLRPLPLVTRANGINDRGEIVGSFEGAAVLWSRGRVRDLNELIPANSGWNLQTATAINRFGQIVGSGLYQGRTAGFLLTPE